jgi:transposase InsO family protein
MSESLGHDQNNIHIHHQHRPHIPAGSFRSRYRKCGPASAACDSQGQASPPKPAPCRPSFLDRAALDMVTVGKRPHHCKAGHSGALAPHEVPIVLALEITQPANRTAESFRRNPGAHSKDGSVAWGAPRVHAELLKLGFEVDERTISRCMPKRPPDPGKIQRWITFLRNHKDCMAGMDFFTVPSATFNLLYVFFVIHHARRIILHFAVTTEPYASWIVQQLREAFPKDRIPRYLILDRDGKYGDVVPTALKTMGVKLVRTAYRAPWQNPFSERFVGSVRRELLDHVVVLNEAHLHRLLSDYISYYHDDRCHLGLDKETPTGRDVTKKPSADAWVTALPRVGGLHHRYEWRQAA